MTILRWTIRVHKWLALIVGIQIVLWVTGGVVMSVLPIERVRGEHNIAVTEPAVLPMEQLLAPGEISRRAMLGPIREVTLETWLGRPVYHFERVQGPVVMADAVSGEVLSPIDEAMAVRVARADFAGDAEIEAVEFFAEPTWEFRRAEPAWRISFADGEGTRLYVSPATGKVTARRNDTWRFYDFFWMLHIMDYDEREDFNHPLLIAFAAFSLVTVLAGLLLLILKMQRFFLSQLKQMS